MGIPSARSIGSVEVIPLIDGEIQGPPLYMYPGIGDEEVLGNRRFLDEFTGNFGYTTGAYLLRMGDRTVLVDAGNGPTPKTSGAGGALRSSLAAAGVTPADITDVVITHLHFDHIGWISVGGRPYFPNATIRCDARDWNYFMSDDYETPDWEIKASDPTTDSARARLTPVRDRTDLWEGTAPIIPGLDAIDAAGHTPGTCIIMVSSDGERGALLGDIVHSKPELINAWTFRTHTDVAAAAASVRQVRDYLATEELVCSGSHFPGLSWGYVVADGDRGYVWEDA